MNFGEAIGVLHDGGKVSRDGGATWIELVRGGWHVGSHRLQDFIVMKTDDGSMVPWEAAQADILADDWQLVET